MASIQGSGLTFAYNTFLRRELSLADLTDVTAARNVLGMSGILTPGAGLTGGSFGPGSGNVGFAVDSSSIGIPGKITMYDSSGNLTAVNTLNLGSGGATITRASGTDGNFSLTSTGAGVFSLNNGSGIIQLVTGGRFQLTAAGTDPSTITTSAGLSVSLANGATGTGLSVAGGLNVDSLYGAITDLTNGTSSTVAASAKAVATVSTAAATAQSAADAAQTSATAASTLATNKLDLTTTTAQSVASDVTFTNGLIIPANRGITTFRFYQQWTNGATTALVSNTSILGYAINILPTTSAVENTDDAYDVNDPVSGFITSGICSLPVTGRYFYSFQYTGSVSCSVVVQKGSSAVVTYGPSLAVSGSGTFAAQSGTKVALRVIGGTPTLTANQCWMHIYLINGGSQINKV